MKARSKRVLTLLMSTALTVSCLAACGQSTSNQSEVKKDTTVKESSAESSTAVSQETQQVESQEADPFGKYEEEITLRGAFLETPGIKYIPGNPDYDSAENNMWITAYKEDLGINVVYDWVSADPEAYNTKWNMAMAQNNLPDFGTVNAETYKMLLDADLVMDMTDIFEEYASDMYKEFLDADGGATRGYSTQNGRLMGLPLTGAQPDDIAIFTIRKDWLDKVGMEVPTTIDELVEAAQAFTDNKLGGEGTYGLVLQKDAFSTWVRGAKGFANGYGAYPGAWVMDESGKIIYGSTSEKMIEPLLKLQEMYKKGLINQDFAVTEGSIAKEDVVSGKVGISYDAFHCSSGASDNIKNDPEAEWVVAEIPTSDGSPAVAQGAVSSSNFIFVNKNCEHPEAVVKLINLQIAKMNSDDSETVLKYTTHTSPADETVSIQTSLYCASVQFCARPWQNLIRYQDATKALETGVEEFRIPLAEKTYNDFKLKIEQGERGWWMIFGPGGTFSVIEKMYNEERIILDEYQSIPTVTMSEKKESLDTALNAAMEKVIMGEDISVYEKAVKEWYQNGGQIMTDEVNAWYESNH